MATATRAAMRPYSMAVAPDSSWMRRLSVFMVSSPGHFGSGRRARPGIGCTGSHLARSGILRMLRYNRKQFLAQPEEKFRTPSCKRTDLCGASCEINHFPTSQEFSQSPFSGCAPPSIQAEPGVCDQGTPKLRRKEQVGRDRQLGAQQSGPELQGGGGILPAGRWAGRRVFGTPPHRPGAPPAPRRACGAARRGPGGSGRAPRGRRGAVGRAGAPWRRRAGSAGDGRARAPGPPATRAGR